MDFFKKSCKELCEQLCNNKIKTKDELDEFIKAKCAEYDKKSTTDTKSEVIGKEKEYLDGIYEALEKKDIVTKLTELQKALEQLGRRTNVKFGSIFLGVGTGTYYREAAKKIKKELKIHVASKGELENLKKQLNEAAEKQKKELQEKENLQEKLKKITEEKKKQEEKLEKQKNFSNQKSEEKGRKRKDKLKNLIENKDLFRGLPNGESYCYLNTAIQNLYYDKSFSDKVLKTPIPENKKPECKELYAVKVFFLYLAGKLTLNHFNSLRKDLARDLGYNYEYSNSRWMQQHIELTCRRQMQLLKPKEKEPVFDTEFYTNVEEPSTTSIKWKEPNTETTAEIIYKLYNDSTVRGLVAELPDEDLKETNNEKLIALKSVFELIKTSKFNYANAHQNIEIIQTSFDESSGSFNIRRKNILDWLHKFKRSKKSKLLSIDSDILMEKQSDLGTNVFLSIEKYINTRTANKNMYYLPLKNNCFTVAFGDRHGREVRKNFTVEEDLNLESLVNSEKLKIFQKNEEIKKYKFKLISATIGTGGHYYIYRKIGNQWEKFNDSNVSDCTWENIQGDICERCELLMYELV